MSLRVLPIAVIACLTGRAAAERRVDVVAPGAPFAAHDLEAALRVRIAADGPPVTVHVIAAAGDHLTVALGELTREVDLGGRTGEDAARLVALAIADLALDDLAVAPRSDAPKTTFAFELLGTAGSWTDVLAGAGIDLVVAHGGWVASLGFTGDAGVSGTLHLATTPIRACAGKRFDQLELRAGVALAPVWVEDGVGDRLTMFGVTASARLRFAGLGTHLIAAVGVDAYTTQTTYQLDAQMLTTPWLAPWLAVGMEVSP